MSKKQSSSHFEPIAVSGESTVVAEFLPDGARETAYQSEAELERKFIEQLQSQAYEYLDITTEKELIVNLRSQIEKLNKFKFSDAEWDRFFTTRVSGSNDGITEKTARIQEDSIQLLVRDDGTFKNIRLIDREQIHNNSLQVINQYESKGKRANRYDVTVLVNGLPMVHIELKRRGVDIREAFNQINRYQRESFWAECGLFEYVQLFVISNGTLTKYYSNTVRMGHLDERRKPSRRKTSNSFSFTTWWADAKNRRINELNGFTQTFFAKHTLLNILTRYCVFDVDRKLLVMRPYQIVATEQILQRIKTATNFQNLGKISGGGYIWHATGSGKTLTSFKAAQLAVALPEIDKVLFVVDRKDLDYQTMREYDRFEKGAANSNTSTRELQKQLEDKSKRLIITTIQKLSLFVQRNKRHAVYGMHVVIIFDECHRSQFGDMHATITRAFKRYHLFGFTGTPIFADNASSQGNPKYRTTEQVFGDKLHAYTIVDAISDKNVLPFRIDYINTVKTSPKVKDEKVSAIATEQALLHPERVAQVVNYIRVHFNQKTKRNIGYHHSGKRIAGFNSIFATESIDAAKRYYHEFSEQQPEEPLEKRLKIGLIYSFAPNEEESDGLLGEEGFEPDKLDQSSRDFLDDAISDYNSLFSTNFDTTSDKFQNYYKDVSDRLKKRELDLVIVVNMFLTGFDATTLNTLWVDKRLRSHGLIQAFSRTNRILNSVKTYGNIVSFRDLETATNDALALFGNKDAKGIVLLKPYATYYEEYRDLISTLTSDFPLNEEINSESAQKEFVRLFGSILRLKNILTAFDEFEGNEIIDDRASQDYQSRYLYLYEKIIPPNGAEKESIVDDLVFEIELIKSIEINVDYILMKVEEYLRVKGQSGDKEIRASIQRAVNSSPSLRSKKDLIEKFVDSVSTKIELGTAWVEFIETEMRNELDRIINQERLHSSETKIFVENAFRDGAIPETGTAITKILPPTSKFSQNNSYAVKKQSALSKLERFFDRFFGLIN
ncbi:MAG: type I restriction endonuclease subunit R [Bacteroidetes bacterium]|nr:type I restriction endonuclease subunit R [Bacteroidota bacterium]